MIVYFLALSCGTFVNIVSFLSLGSITIGRICNQKFNLFANLMIWVISLNSLNQIAGLGADSLLRIFIIILVQPEECISLVI